MPAGEDSPGASLGLATHYATAAVPSARPTGVPMSSVLGSRTRKTAPTTGRWDPKSLRQDCDVEAIALLTTRIAEGLACGIGRRGVMR